jgi:tetratricopeptide (TPR) repeat protein
LTRYATTLTVSLLAALLLSQSILPALAVPPPSNAMEPVLIKADRLLRQGQASGAQALYLKWIQRNPNDWQARLKLGDMLEHLSRFEEAERLIEEAMNLNPGNPEPVARLGQLYNHWTQAFWMPDRPDNAARAEELLKQAVSIDPRNTRALSNLAEWQIDHNDTVLADKNIRKALEINPNHANSFRQLARLNMKLRNYGKANRYVFHVMELEPETAENYDLLSQLLAAVDDPDQAVKYASRAQMLDYIEHPARLNLLAQQYEKLAESDKAIKAYEDLLNWNSGNETWLLKLAGLYEAKGNPSQSLAYFRQAVGQNPKLMLKFIEDAENASRMERITDGLNQWRRILALEPGRPEALHGIASLHYFSRREGKVDKAALDKDIQLLRQQPYPLGVSNALLTLNQLKLQIAFFGAITPDIKEQLEKVVPSNDDLAAGEALFLLGRYSESASRLEYIEGDSPQDYLQKADRLLLDGELMGSLMLYERGYRLSPLPALKDGVSRVQGKRALAERRVNDGDTAFAQKDWYGALRQYQASIRLYPQGTTAYLRAAEAYEYLKQPENAYKMVDTAVRIQPGLLDSQAFRKRYEKLRKKYGPQQPATLTGQPLPGQVLPAKPLSETPASPSSQALPANTLPSDVTLPTKPGPEVAPPTTTAPKRRGKMLQGQPLSPPQQQP